MSHIIKLALAIAAFLRANWPKILTAFNAVSVYLQKHPNVSADLRGRFEKVRERLASARAEKTPEAQIRAMLNVVTDVAAGSGVADTPRSDYVQRAERLQMALGVAEKLSGRDKRRAIARIRAQTDALAAEAIESLLPGSSGGGDPVD